MFKVPEAFFFIIIIFEMKLHIATSVSEDRLWFEHNAIFLTFEFCHHLGNM